MIINRIKVFFEDARQEFRHVNWPTYREATRLTLVVIAISLALAAFLGFFDFFFQYVLKAFVLGD